MTDQQESSGPGDSHWKFGYHGNQYWIFIGDLNSNTSERDLIEVLEIIAVTDIIDVKIQRNEIGDSKRYAEVHLFSTDSVERIKENYPITSLCYNEENKIFLEHLYADQSDSESTIFLRMMQAYVRSN